MNRVAHALGVLLAGALTAWPGAAQTVEFSVPEQYNLVEGQLSVTFEDAVAEDEARQLLAQLGYEPVAVTFSPVRLIAVAAQPLAPAQLEQLRAAASVLAAEQREASREAAGAWRYEVAVSFSSPTSAEQARALVRQVASDLWVQRVEKRPNEAVIRVEAGQEEKAIEALEGQAPVRYVSYIHMEQ